MSEEPDSGVNTTSGKCWPSITETPITSVVIGTSQPDTSAWTKVAWSPSNLYVLAYVQNWPLPTGGASLWNGQTVEFYVSGNNTKAATFGPEDGQFGILAGSSTVNKGVNSQLTVLPTGMSNVVQGQGYYAELIVPWKGLGVSSPASGQEYKFDVAADFSNDTGTQVAQLMWTGTQNNYETTVGWGSIKLG